MQSDFAIGVAPDQSDRQAAPELPARRLITDPAVKAGAKNIELRFSLIVPFEAATYYPRTAL